MTAVPLASFFLIISPTGAILGACFALAAATLLFIFYIQPDASDLAPHRSKLDQLMERRDAIYDNLRDLRFEYRAGKYSEADFAAMKTAMETEAALVLAELKAASLLLDEEVVSASSGKKIHRLVAKKPGLEIRE